MKKMCIPKPLQELFGEEQLLAEIIIVLTLTISVTALLAVVTIELWLTWSPLKIAVFWILFVDMAGGTAANLTEGTDLYYHQRPKLRLIFIATHIQPIILSFTLQGSPTLGIGVYIFSVVCALIVNWLDGKPYQRVTGFALMAVGLVALYLCGRSISSLLICAYMLYMMKLIYSFAVFHHSAA